MNRLNLQKVAQRQTLSPLLAEYFLATDPSRALELASFATAASGFQSWYWKTLLGQAYLKIGLLREAERQLKSSLELQDMVLTHCLLVKVYLRLDVPLTALAHLAGATTHHPHEPSLILLTARIQEMLNNIDTAAKSYREVLVLDGSRVEAIACLAANLFYAEKPELSLRLYRRLLQMGVGDSEVWNNVGLCCYYSLQYDMSLSCFGRALEEAAGEASVLSAVWYNIGCVALGIGDTTLAHQAFEVAASIDPHHAESYTNAALLDLRASNTNSARANLLLAEKHGEHLFEPFYNSAVLDFKAGDVAGAFTKVQRALSIFPKHPETLELLGQINLRFGAL